MGTIYLGNVLGATGPTGPGGGSGGFGPTGATGASGGPVGATGATGPIGPDGQTGELHPGYVGTVTSGTISLGSSSTDVGSSYSITTQEGLAFVAGTSIRLYGTDSIPPLDINLLEGTVTSYGGTLLVFTVTYKTGSISSPNWNISLAGGIGPTGPLGPSGPQGQTGSIGATGPIGPREIRGLSDPVVDLVGGIQELDCTSNDAFVCKLSSMSASVRLNNMSLGQVVFVKVKTMWGYGGSNLDWESPDGSLGNIIYWSELGVVPTAPNVDRWKIYKFVKFGNTVFNAYEVGHFNG